MNSRLELAALMIPRPGTAPVPVVRMPPYLLEECFRFTVLPSVLGLTPCVHCFRTQETPWRPPWRHSPSSLSPSFSSASIGGRGSLSVCLPGLLSHDLCTSLPNLLLSSPLASPQVPFPLGWARAGFCPFQPRAPTHSHPSCSWGCLRSSGRPGPGAQVSKPGHLATNRWGKSSQPGAGPARGRRAGCRSRPEVSRLSLPLQDGRLGLCAPQSGSGPCSAVAQRPQLGSVPEAGGATGVRTSSYICRASSVFNLKVTCWCHPRGTQRLSCPHFR